MTPTTSFAPLAGRLSAMADEICSGFEARPIGEKIVGWVFLVLLHCLIRICHEVDARAAADAAKVDSGFIPEERRAGDARPVATGQATPRFRLRLVASRADDAAVPCPLPDAVPPRRERPARAWAPQLAEAVPAPGVEDRDIRKNGFAGMGSRTPISLRYRN